MWIQCSKEHNNEITEHIITNTTIEWMMECNDSHNDDDWWNVLAF